MIIITIRSFSSSVQLLNFCVADDDYATKKKMVEIASISIVGFEKFSQTFIKSKDDLF